MYISNNCQAAKQWAGAGGNIHSFCPSGICGPYFCLRGRNFSIILSSGGFFVSKPDQQKP